MNASDHIQKRLAKLESVLSGAAGGSPPIILQAQVDPDSIGSSLGAQFLLQRRFDISASIGYFGSVSHPQNRALFNKLNLYQRMKSLTWDQIEPARDIILVDSSTLQDARLGDQATPRELLAVIDHHRGSTLVENDRNFVWVEDVGAASTLITELISAADLKFGDSDSLTALVLALGIYADSYKLTAATSRDFAAFEWLRQYFNQDDFTELLNYPLPPSYFRNLQHALNRLKLSGSRLVAFAGCINPDEGDDLAVIADDLIRRTGTSLAVVFGVIGDKDGCVKVRFSARNQDITMSLSGFLHARFGEGTSGAKLLEDGRGIGGGLCCFNLGSLAPNVSQECRLQIVEVLMDDLIFRE